MDYRQLSCQVEQLLQSQQKIKKSVGFESNVPYLLIPPHSENLRANVVGVKNILAPLIFHLTEHVPNELVDSQPAVRAHANEF